MERLSIYEVIEHCKRHTERMESHSGRSQLEETPVGNSNSMKQYWEHRQVAEWLEQLKSYKDLEEQGLLLRLPCKVGNIVYRINKGARQPVIALVVTEIRHKALRNGNVALKIICSDDVMTKINGSLVYYEEEIGKKMFLTKSEAERALARMEGGNE